MKWSHHWDIINYIKYIWVYQIYFMKNIQYLIWKCLHVLCSNPGVANFTFQSSGSDKIKGTFVFERVTEFLENLTKISGVFLFRSLSSDFSTLGNNGSNRGQWSWRNTTLHEMLCDNCSSSLRCGYPGSCDKLACILLTLCLVKTTQCKTVRSCRFVFSHDNSRRTEYACQRNYRG